MTESEKLAGLATTELAGEVLQLNGAVHHHPPTPALAAWLVAQLAAVTATVRELTETVRKRGER